MAALEWINTGADVINHSEEYGFEPPNQMTWTDHAFDFWARQNIRLIVVGTGLNTHTELGNSLKGWNVLTVGGFNDNNTSQWAGDTMDPGSPFVNPVSPQNDREKPEVVAVSVNVEATTVNNGIQNNTGTSVAAPQIAGLAALLMKRNADLKSWPEATTAIIMAASLHNIEGPTDIVAGQDLKDGAGAPNGNIADKIATNHYYSATTVYDQPGWWGIPFCCGGGPIDRFIQVGANKRVRVAIRWWAHADCRNAATCFYDRLDSDLDLEVLAPGGNYVPEGWVVGDGEDSDGGSTHGSVSQSWDNNYELVDFVAPVAGVYTIRIRRSRVDPLEIQNWVGVAAWMKP